jgi:pimeloyl-ACP methyl ester carboxylesterase
VVPENTSRCLSELSEVADLRFYGTHDAVRDLEDVRKVLGYERIDILGISYGTRITWLYARKFPSRLRSVILLSPNPPSQRLLESAGDDARRALHLLASDCRADRDCRVRFPEFEDELGAVWDKLTPTQRIALPLLLYSVGETRRLPWMVNQAARGNTQPLDQALVSALASGQRQISLGLHLTVQCSEELPIARRIEGDGLAGPLWDEYARACEGWPRIPVPRSFRDSFRSEARALVISGEWDPATPPRWADEMAKLFAVATVVIIPKGTHGLSEIGECIGTVAARFLNGRPADTRCLDSLALRPYVLP